ncbi:hypothetical protein [Caulobacter sp. BK020]|uniref:hypothetical protein n=1 Tax=Caulobacter sp. BK020 TaxID=2512117 RepID=UPI0010515F7D|nr:hypothetical protein [Caulobacter sp. BK020]
MTTKKPRTPQEKKALSYANDRRSDFGESPHAARKSIPLRKAKENRKARHEADQALRGLDRLDEAAADLVESSVRQDVARVGGWTKSPDATLSEHLDRQLKRRVKFDRDGVD